MLKKSKSYKEKSWEEINIFAYGFEAVGFETPREPIKLNNIGIIEFIQLHDPQSLDSAEGIITPQGIFEEIKRARSTFGGYTINVRENILLERERQVYNLLKQGKWICFLVEKIIDEIYQGFTSYRKDIKDTDLCKRLLNKHGISRHIVDGLSPLEAKENEFISYIHEYGVAKTVLEIPYYKDIESRVIAITGNQIVGVEFNNQLFFLPFHTTKKSKFDSNSIVKTIASAIFNYRQKRIKELPDWLNEFHFESEKILISNIISLNKRKKKLQAQLQSWKEYKAILTTSGDILKNRIIKILKNFFELKIDPIDETREDAKIIDDKGNICIMIEVKGTKKGIKREYINQVDSHRERNELQASIPGVLFINNEMSVDGIDNRLRTKVPDEHIKHAKKLNILIVRTIDLLLLMQHLENNSDRKDELMGLLQSGGGWLKANPESYKII